MPENSELPIQKPVLHRATEKKQLPFLEASLRIIGLNVAPKINNTTKGIETSNNYKKKDFINFVEEKIAMGEVFGEKWEENPELVGFYSFLTTATKNGEKIVAPWLLTVSRGQAEKTWQNGKKLWEEIIKENPSQESGFFKDIENGNWQLPLLQGQFEEKYAQVSEKPIEKIQKDPIIDPIIEGAKHFFLVDQITQLLVQLPQPNKEDVLMHKLALQANEMAYLLDNELNCTFENYGINETLPKLIKGDQTELNNLIKKDGQKLLEIFHCLCLEKWSRQACELDYMKEDLSTDQKDLLGHVLPYEERVFTDEKTGQKITEIDVVVHDLGKKPDGKEYLYISPFGYKIPIDKKRVDKFGRTDFYCDSPINREGFLFLYQE